MCDKKESLNGFNDIYWHDATLRNVTFTAEGLSALKLEIDVYIDHAATNRGSLSLTFNNVIRWTSNLDIVELLDNSRAGNISNAYMKPVHSLNGETMKEVSSFRFYLCDGFMEVIAESVLIKQEENSWEK